MDKVIIAKFGAAKNFLKYLISDKNTNIWLKDVNEYRSSVNNNSYYWSENKFIPCNFLLKSPVMTYHPISEKGSFSYKPADLQNKKVYYVTLNDKKSFIYVHILGWIKVKLLRNYFHIGTFDYSSDYDPVDIYNLDIEKFSQYCKFLKKNKLLISPLSAWSLKGFKIFNEKTTVDDLKKVIFEDIYEMPITPEDDFLPSIDVSYIDYKDFFINNKPSNTIFDNYMDEVKEYHLRNLKLIKEVSDSWNIDFMKYVPLKD